MGDKRTSPVISTKEQMDKSENIILDIAQELFDIWKEAKSSMGDDWDNVTWDSLPVKHKNEYLLTAARIVKKVRAFFI